MGRLPSTFANRPIRMRIPYNMPWTLNLAPGQVGIQFPEAQFTHNEEKPFEIHRMIVRLTALDGAVPPAVALVQPAAGLLERLVQIRVYDWNKSELLTKNMQLVSTLLKGDGAGAEQTWEWAEPYYLSRGEGLHVLVDNFATASTALNLRCEVNFQGFKVVVAPPSESR